MNSIANEEFDCVVIFAFSLRFTPHGTSPFDYANKLSTKKKVFFVEVHADGQVNQISNSDFANIEIIKINSTVKPEGFNRVLKYIWDNNYVKPLFWVCNPDFIDLLNSIKGAQIILCATTDYFSSGMKLQESYIRKVKDTLLASRLIVAASEGIAKNIVANVPRCKSILVVDKGSDLEIEKLFYEIKNTFAVPESGSKKRRLKGLLIVDINSMENQAIKQHVDGIVNHSLIEFEVVDIRYFNELIQENLHFVDVIMFHFCLRVFCDLINKKTIKLLSKFEGHKALFIQDEYDAFLLTRKRLRTIGFSVIYTCVPEDQVEIVYPRALYKHTKFVTCFTGYITDELLDLKVKLENQSRPRDIDIFYRGRILPLFYGSLGYQKYMIGKRFKELLTESGSRLSNDIEVDDRLRIYGDEWYSRLMRSKTMLGTESGSNVFDFDGKLKEFLENLNKSDLPLGTKIDKLCQRYEGKVLMNQVSPKLFEMFASGCVPVLFKGKYSELISENENFIGLEHDFSNFDEVVSKIQDNKVIQKIRENNFNYILNRKDLYFDTFVREKIDKHLMSTLAFFPKKVDQEIYQRIWRFTPFFLSPAYLTGILRLFIARGVKKAFYLGAMRLKYDPELVYEKVKIRVKKYLRII